MRKYTERHKVLLKEIDERNEFIVGITEERIGNPDAAIPLNYVLESRFNELKKQAIYVEAKINYITSIEEYNEAQVEILQGRLQKIQGAMNELLTVTEMIVKFGKANREFEIVR